MSRRRPRIPFAVRLAVAERDGWRCRLCGEAIEHDPVSEPWPDPLSLTAEHVVPWCYGGSDDAANIAAAHLACNVVRGCSRGAPLPLAAAVRAYCQGGRGSAWERLTDTRRAELVARFPASLLRA